MQALKSLAAPHRASDKGSLQELASLGRQGLKMCMMSCPVNAGSKDPGAPQRASDERQRTYKTKAEVEKTKSSTTLIVAVLLVIAFVVPMLQYYG